MTDDAHAMNSRAIMVRDVVDVDVELRLVCCAVAIDDLRTAADHG